MSAPGENGQSREDLVRAVVEDGIKRDIEVVMGERRYRAAIILMVTAIDVMAYVGLPNDRTDVRRADYIAWVDRYIRFECPQQLPGQDLYGARCAVLHSYGAESTLSRNNQCRTVLWHVRGKNAVLCSAAYPNFVMVALEGLQAALFRAIDAFLAEAMSDPERAARVEARIGECLQEFPADR